MMSAEPRYYRFAPPVCDGCGKPFGSIMHDAQDRSGAWGHFCEACFDAQCVGLGSGLGDTYQKQPNGEWLKVGGSRTAPAADAAKSRCRASLLSRLRLF
jgi:hypothetical protein